MPSTHIRRSDLISFRYGFSSCNISDSVPKPQAHMETPLSEFFNVEVVALSSFEEKEEQFKEQATELRQTIPTFYRSWQACRRSTWSCSCFRLFF
ncbi:hypothetical protein K1719_039790 [Acacia pycnantha]|nr:hypothetical protein K1719_039790 [Acacia pycnantha]